MLYNYKYREKWGKEKIFAEKTGKMLVDLEKMRTFALGNGNERGVAQLV